MHSIKEQIFKDGYAVIENFVTPEQVNSLKLEGLKFSDEAIINKNKHVFQAKDKYFMDSADKVSYFFEADALEEKDDLKIKPTEALNKVGHALHLHVPVFRHITFSQNVKDICRDIGMKKPAVVQSMYIYKNPKIGGAVKNHMDSTFLYTEPHSLYGFWIPVDDATLENGCLWFIPGSHKKNPVNRRFIRNPDSESNSLLIMTGKDQEFDDSEFVPVPVKKGSCVLIHGEVIHRSLKNESEKSRHAYTFHVYDSAISQYSDQNWLQTNFEILQ